VGNLANQTGVIGAEVPAIELQSLPNEIEIERRFRIAEIIKHASDIAVDIDRLLIPDFGLLHFHSFTLLRV
jgi:hypothetical protein